MLARYFIVASVLVAVSALPLSSNTDSRPNVILFFLDELGADRFPFYGSNINLSPHINEFEKKAVRFDAFFSQPICGPSRAALLSGRYSSNTGAYGNGHRRNEYFDESECTLGSTFQAAGYDTALFGKVHAAHRFLFQDKFQYRTFTSICGFNNWAVWARQGPRYQNATIATNIGDGNLNFKELVDAMHDPMRCNVQREITMDSTYSPHLYRELAKGFISASKQTENPFLLHLPTLLVHGPFKQKLHDLSVPPDMQPAPNGVPLFNQRQMILDGIVGDILRHLEVEGLQNNTIVLITGDNGTPRRYPSVVNGIETVSGKRHASHTKGTRVPLLIYDPRLQSSPKEIRAVTHMYDVLPTLMEATGIEDLPPNKELPDGRSFWGFVTEELEDWPRWAFLFSKTRAPHAVIRNQEFIITSDGELFHEEQWYRRISMSPAAACTTHRVLLRKLRNLCHEAWKLDIAVTLPGGNAPVDPNTCRRIRCNSSTSLPECIA